MRRFAEIDAVTIDGFGTLLALRDPVEPLRVLVPGRPDEEIAAALEVEAAYYRAHAPGARDAGSLARLRADCAEAFNSALGTTLDADDFNAAFVFEVLPGVREALRGLRARGLALAVVANWDFGLHEHLRAAALGQWFDAVVISAEIGARKPDPRPFHVALERLRVRPDRAVHVGDHLPHDDVGARAAGMEFAAAPLSSAFAGWA